MCEYIKLNLNGNWLMKYLGKDAYVSTLEPELNGGYEIEGAIPGYWEDMMDKFRENPMHTELNYNPEYTLQRYPQAGYVPDMCLPNVLGSFAYNKEIDVELSLLKGEIELYVGGVQNALSLWINDKFIGKHLGYSSEFSIPLDKSALINGKNKITLVVSNTRLKGYKDRPISGCTSRAANECTGGIYGDVELRAYPDGLKGVRVTTSDDLTFITVTTLGGEKVDRKVKVYDGDKLEKEALIKKGAQKVQISTNGLTSWSVDNPKRYTITIETENQTISHLFGIRKLAVAKDGIHLELNNKPFFFRGICEHGYYPLTVYPPKDKNYYVNVIKTLKKLGFNAVRFHTWVPMAEYMQAADELGMLLEVETPNNTSIEEWHDIVRYTSAYTSVVGYSSGNEMIIDEDYIEHLRECAKLVHENTDSFFSPMSAMRGIEYFTYGNDKVDTPFPHNPVRLKTISEFCDVFNSYSVGRTSYWSEKGEADMIDDRNSIYKKPLLSHEICIHGTYCDLSLKDRYAGSRIGDTELFTSVERHLKDKGIIDRAPLYFKNSSEWQKRLRKHCFETVRRCKTFTGYDFLGDIDHHWHTFGYCVGMMNEFYQLKPAETVQNVLRYNSDAVLLADLPQCLNYQVGDKAEILISLSNYGENIKKALLTLQITSGKDVYYNKEIRLTDIKSGEISPLYKLTFNIPKSLKATAFKLSANLTGDSVNRENEWEFYSFPSVKNINLTKKALKEQKAVILDDNLEYETLEKLLSDGKKVLIFGNGPFGKVNTQFQMALAGRTEGHLATVINNHPLMNDFPHDGFCGWQFRNMLNEGYSANLDLTEIEYKPIIEIASSYKYARREAVLFEYKVGSGKLLVCTLNLPDCDPGARYLKDSIVSYFTSDKFEPEISITNKQLYKICHAKPVCVIENTNEAFNANDITM